MVGLEVIVLVVVIIVSILNPAKDTADHKTDFKNVEQNIAVEVDVDTEAGFEAEPLVYSDAVKAKVQSMSLEHKIAQLFVTTPEELTGMQQVTATGNTTKRAMSEIPVGGLVYTSLNFEGKLQTASMTKNLQNYYREQFQMPLFMMISEKGGAEGSPLATANGFEVEMSPAEVGADGNSEQAVVVAANIAKYLSNQGLNTNILSGGEYSEDEVIADNMLSATVNAYKEADIFTASDTYDQNADIIMIPATEPFYRNVQKLRENKKYQGIILADSVSEESMIIEAVNAGADMVYCPSGFKTAYQAVVDAAANGTISEEVINEAVMRILSFKGYE